MYDWDLSLETGSEEIDAQHRGIFELANRLHETCGTRGPNSDELADAVYGLSDYVVQHFSDEEALMERASYPELPEHRSLHQQLTGEVLRITTRYFEGDDVSLRSLAPFLAEWLRTHIGKHDRRFVDFQESK